MSINIIDAATDSVIYSNWTPFVDVAHQYLDEAKVKLDAEVGAFCSRCKKFLVATDDISSIENLNICTQCDFESEMGVDKIL